MNLKPKLILLNKDWTRIEVELNSAMRDELFELIEIGNQCILNLNLWIRKYMLSCIIFVLALVQNQNKHKHPYLCHVMKVLRCTVMPKHVMSFEVAEASESVKSKP